MKRIPLLFSLVLMLGSLSFAQERRVIIPSNGAKPIGPYSPGILVKNYLYVSGQGVRDANNNLPAGIAAQTRQCLENVKAIIDAAGLSLEHIVHLQLYLEQISDLPEVEKVYAEYFPKNPPARIILGVAKMPSETTVEMTAVAVRDLKMKKVLNLKSLPRIGNASPAIQVNNRIYFSGVYGNSPSEAEVLMKKVLAEAKVKVSNVLLSNFYSTSASALIPIRELPEQMQSAYSVIAAKKGVNRGKDTASFCAAESNTIFCSVQVGNNDGSRTVKDQIKSVMQKLYAGLESHGARLSLVTASNVYLDDLKEFRAMNETYASFFTSAAPTRTTVQPFPSADRSQGNPSMVRISVIAVKE